MKNFLFLVIYIVVVGLQSCTVEEYQDKESYEFTELEQKAGIVKNLSNNDETDEDIE